MFRLKYEKPSSGEIKTPSKIYYINDIIPLAESTAENSTLHF